MVTWKLATRLSLVILILIFAAACSREAQPTGPTSTPTLDSTATPGGTPGVSPALTPVTPVAVTRPKPVSGPVDGYLAVAPSVSCVRTQSSRSRCRCSAEAGRHQGTSWWRY